MSPPIWKKLLSSLFIFISTKNRYNKPDLNYYPLTLPEGMVPWKNEMEMEKVKPSLCL